MAADDMIVPMLREMRVELNKRFDQVEQRLEKVERAQTAFRHAIQGIMLSNATTNGELETMIERLEERVVAIEKREKA
jgi:hypothetical protein